MFLVKKEKILFAVALVVMLMILAVKIASASGTWHIREYDYALFGGRGYGCGGGPRRW